MPTEEKVLEAIAKTGFVLEHEVVTTLQSAGWKTISGSYYIDDVSNQARELDIIAYKIARLEEVHVLTCALVSCKKDAKHTAAFLSRARPGKDPNADWEPAHQATRLQPLKAHLTNVAWKDRYFSSMNPTTKRILVAERDVFAFQMVDDDGRAHNDKPYYDSFTGLIKALDHELTKRSQTNIRNRKRIYALSLYTVLDAPMVDVRFEGVTQHVCQIDRITCFTRYMVQRQDTSASIHFLRSTAIRDWISDLDALHAHNRDFFKDEIGNSFEAITSSSAVREYFREEIGHLIKHYIAKAATRLNVAMPKGELFLGVNKRGLEISMDFSEEDVITLNSDFQLQEGLSALFKRRARYDGKFEIATFDIPF